MTHNQQPLWSVWKHNGKEDAEWELFVEDEDASYVKHVYRYVQENIFKSGLLQLRCQQEVLNECHLQRPSSRNDYIKDNKNDPRFDGYKEIQKLVLVNSILKPLFQQYQDGKLTYKRFLEEAVINLHFDHLHLTDEGVEVGDEQQVNVLTKKAALEVFSNLLQVAKKNLDEIYGVVSLLEPNPAYAELLYNVLRNTAALIRLHPEMGIQNYLADEMIANLVKEKFESEREEKLKKKELERAEKLKKKKENELTGIKRPRGRPRKNKALTASVLKGTES